MNRRQGAIAGLEARLDHVFADRELLERALTHASVGGGGTKYPDNDRLEFLGDRVLGLVLAGELFREHPEANSGDLSKRFHALVNREACARVARIMGLGDALRLQGGESRRGGRDHDTILADGCEAVIAALYLDAGFGKAAATVLALWAPLIEEPLDAAAANPKSELQEWAAEQSRSAPVYRVVSREGPDHEPSFTVEVSVSGAGAASATAGSVRAAEKAAALVLLKRERPSL